MSVFEATTFGSSLAIAFSFLCRLDMLHIREHRFDVILFYVMGLGAVMSAASHAWQGLVDLQDVCIIIGLGAWILTSYRTWSRGVPDYFKRPA